MIIVGTIAIVVGLALAMAAAYVVSERKTLLDLAEERKRRILDSAQKKADRMDREARDRVAESEEKIQSLRWVAKELGERLNESYRALQRRSDEMATAASSIDYVSDDELLESGRYQADRKELRKELKRLAADAIEGISKTGDPIEAARFAAVSAKADMAGALLLTTAELLSSKMTTGNGHASMEKLNETIRACEALIKMVDSDMRMKPEFESALRKRLQVELDYRRAKEKSREEQRELREREREERKVREEAERVRKEVEREEREKRRSIEELERRVQAATDQERAKIGAEIEELRRQLEEAHERGRRALSRAQQTRQGHVYILSNIGSFGEDVYKLGMTRRLEPEDRVKELSDASVPFSFDIHAMIETDDAPSLESELHRHFHDHRVNKVNMRKEFFRVSLDEISAYLEDRSMDVSIRSVPSADEYYASIRSQDSMEGSDVESAVV